MKLVIDIDEKYYEILKHDVKVNHMDYIPCVLIANGTPLPKGHGDLIDANELCEGRVSNDPVVIAAKCAPTIVEADKE